MRRLLAVLCLLLLAAPADAARYVGTWFKDDNVKALRLSIRDENGNGWGTAVGPCYTPKLYLRKAGGTTTIATATCTWEDSTESACLVMPGTLTSLFPTTGYRDYDFVLYMEKIGGTAKLAADDAAEPFRLRLQVYP